MRNASNPKRIVPRTIYFPDGEHTLTATDVARILGLSCSRVCSMAREGLIRSVRLRIAVRGRLLFAAADVAEYQRRRTAAGIPT